MCNEVELSYNESKSVCRYNEFNSVDRHSHNYLCRTRRRRLVLEKFPVT